MKSRLGWAGVGARAGAKTLKELRLILGNLAFSPEKTGVSSPKAAVCLVCCAVLVLCWSVTHLRYPLFPL